MSPTDTELDEDRSLDEDRARERDLDEDVDTWLQGKLALVVDDDPDVRGFVREVLERAGMRVKSARDGAEALAQLANQAPDVVLLDMRMPRMSGDEVLELLSQLRGRPPIVIMTAAERARDLALAHHNPLYLSKPFDAAYLLATVETALEQDLAAPANG